MGIAGNMLRVRTINRIGKTFGFNLIELLVSLVVVAVSLFAVAKIQIFGLQAGEGSKQSTASTTDIVKQESIPATPIDAFTSEDSTSMS